MNPARGKRMDLWSWCWVQSLSQVYFVTGEPSAYRRTFFMTLDLTFSWIRHQKCIGNKRKRDTLDYIKIQHFHISKDTVNRLKRHSRELKQIFARHVYDKWIISGLYNERLKLNNKKPQTTCLKSRQRTWIDISPKNIYKLCNKHMETCSASQITREMQIKTT